MNWFRISQPSTVSPCAPPNPRSPSRAPREPAARPWPWASLPAEDPSSNVSLLKMVLNPRKNLDAKLDLIPCFLFCMPMSSWRPHLLSHRQARPGRRQAAGRTAGRDVARTAVAAAEDQRQRTRLDELIQLLRLPGKVAVWKDGFFGILVVKMLVDELVLKGNLGTWVMARLPAWK